jgi:hypothetical protein
MFWIKRLNKGAFRMAALSALPPSVESAAKVRFEPFLTFQTTESMAALCQKLPSMFMRRR